MYVPEGGECADIPMPAAKQPSAEKSPRGEQQGWPEYLFDPGGQEPETCRSRAGAELMAGWYLGMHAGHRFCIPVKWMVS
ncbi:hypothetical protein DSO57_1033432 [Entomophthora muscae]|uniref:Uncharacterized protein n=1 Tax=Entomophthora muscae TaxID=34485 RepID=A0ACC2U9K7_9FUNG|nr:hypothetical protein DSO57_1033432 [Entomophthora muscae]